MQRNAFGISPSRASCRYMQLCFCSVSLAPSLCSFWLYLGFSGSVFGAISACVASLPVVVSLCINLSVCTVSNLMWVRVVG